MIEEIFHYLAYMKSKAYTILLSQCFSSIGDKTIIIPPFRFANLSQIQIGARVTIHEHCWIQALLTKEEKPSLPKLVIHDHVSIGMNATISAAKSIVIDEHVVTARNVYISDHTHKYDNINIPIALQGINLPAEVKIGAHTWLGQNSVILPGVTIGRHCIIGANSVVTKDIPDYSVAVGIPATVIKQYDGKNSAWINLQML
jgi:acetyltransferase-like isoleucine patch superfamily enzyme